jgi:hypothetical protein
VKLVAPHPLDGIDASGIIAGEVEKRGEPMGFWHRFQNGQSTWSDDILKAIMEKQKAGAPLPHAPARMKKDVDEFPQFPGDTTTGHAAWTDWPWKLHRIDGEKFELYDLESDPMETEDVSSRPGNRERLARMKGELEQWMRSVVGSINGDDYGER